MKKLTIAFLYNIRHVYPDPGDAAAHNQADYDDPPTIQHMTRHLTEMGYEVIPIEANEDAYFKLHQNRDRIGLAYNYSMGLYGKSRYAHLPSILEMLRIPYTGSSPLTQALVLDKAKMQEVLKASGVPTLPSQVFRKADEPLSPGLTYPLIVKPVSQGSSAGITKDSVVNNAEELRRQVGFILKTFQQPALVQRFLTGREFSVPVLGNPPSVMPIIEPVFSKLPEGFLPFDSLEVKWIFEEQVEENHLQCPAELNEELRKEIGTIALNAWNALDIQDYCRMDMRQDHITGRIYVLDVNSPAGMIPPEVSMSSYFPLSARAAGLSYQELLGKIIDSARKRYGI